MRENVIHILAVIGPRPVLLGRLVMQSSDNVHERDDARAAQRIAQRHVELRLRRNGMQQGYQQVLIGEDNGCLDTG